MHGERAQVIGGTPWLFASPEMRGQFDLLIIDEAGQMSLANALAASLAAKNVILVGDPRQLQQPVRGDHPVGVDRSALDHYIPSHTVAPQLGVFIDRTHRMSGPLTKAVSAISYGQRLKSHPTAVAQRVLGSGPLAGAGVRVILVDHENNKRSSVQEAEVIKRLLDNLEGRPWVAQDGETRPLSKADVLIQAPWNQQVNLLRRVLGPDKNIRTVDKAQGQEAPVAVYSLATSSPDDLTRNWGFLMSLTG